MPQLGETVTEGTVTRWLKAVGDHVDLDEPLLEVSTDKVQTEIPSAHEGTVARLVVAEGETVPIGALLALVGDGTDLGAGDDGDDGDDGATVQVEAAHRPAHRQLRAFRRGMEGGQGYLHTPLRPRWPRVAPTGPSTSSASTPSPVSDPEPTGSVGSQPESRQVDDAMAPSAPIDTRDVARRVPHSDIRRRTAEHLTTSIRTAAHTLAVVEVDYSAVAAARDAHQAAWRAREGFGLSYLPFVARAVCDALVAFPLLNASVDVDGLVVHRSVHLGIAVDLDHEGLIVPVVRSAGSLRLGALAQRVKELADAAHRRTLGGDDIAGGTFTITNAGGYGTLVTAPIINPPQVAILSTDGVGMRPVAVPLDDGGYGVAIHPVGNLALSFDHRAVDGAYASAFLDRVRRILAERDWEAELAATDWGTPR
jgi:2-oxoglutarate dehydrogenase E2 component (dihydrolipoamide succinyltransferase)